MRVVKMENLEDNLRDYVQTNGYTQPQTELDDNGWSLASEDTQKVLAKLGRSRRAFRTVCRRENLLRH